MLQIAIHGDDVLALGVVEAGGEGAGLAEVAAELDDEDAGVYGGDLFQQAVGAIARTVVDEYQLEAVARVTENVLHDGLEAVVEGGHVVLFVVEGYDDGVFQHVFMIRRERTIGWRLSQ